MKTKKRVSKNRKGLVLPLVICIAVILAIIGMGLIQLGFGSRLIAALTTSGISARAAADAGITHALYEMNQHFTIGVGWDGILPPDVVNQPLDNSIARFSYHVEGPFTGPTDEYWLITSTGTSGRETRTVYAMTSITNLFDYALIVTDTITLHSGTLVDGYDSTQGYPSGEVADLKIGTNNSKPPPPTYPITLNNYVVVEGDVLVGVGGNPDELIWDQANPGATTGLRYPLNTPFEFELIIPPDSYDAPPLHLIGSELKIEAPVVYTIEDPYTVVAPAVNIQRNPGLGRLTVVGHVALHVTGDMIFGQGAELYVGDPMVPPEDPNWIPSSLTIYLDGDLEGRNAGGINNLSEIPAYFKLFGTGPPYQDWDIKNDRDFYGIYYGPNANIIIRAYADVYGSVSGHRYDMRNSGNMHYDVRLRDLDAYDTGFAIDRWWEVLGPGS